MKITVDKASWVCYYRDNGERVSLEKQQRKKQMNDIVCGCSVCDGPIYESQLDGETVDENRVYKCGELQYIELFHATCAYEYARRCQIEFQESLGEESLWE